ncbi:MAG: response regulator [Sediminicola sp.]
MAQHTFVVDDDPIVLFLMKKLLGAYPFAASVQYYEKSMQALSQLKGMYSMRDRYLIFLDINMPEVDGWEFLRSLSRFADPSNTFVVIITSSTDLQDKKRAEADPYTGRLLVKPVLQENLDEITKEMGWE